MWILPILNSVIPANWWQGVNIALGGDGNVLISRAAASESLDSAGALIQIKHKVEEIKVLALLFIYQHKLRQSFVFAENSGQLLFGEGILFVMVAYNRLNGYLVKA